MIVTPRTMALRFRVWAYCEPRGWDVTIPELAEHLGLGRQFTQGLLQGAGWLIRVRKVSAHEDGRLKGGDITGALAGGAIAQEREVIADLRAGRISYGEHV